MATPKQSDPQFKLRMTQILKEQIEAAASANNRSMNAEIVARLEHSFEFPTGPYAPALVAQLLERLSRQDEMLTKIMQDRDEYIRYLKDFAGDSDR